jgi:hypothetical protein
MASCGWSDVRNVSYTHGSLPMAISLPMIEIFSAHPFLFTHGSFFAQYRESYVSIFARSVYFNLTARN